MRTDVKKFIDNQLTSLPNKKFLFMALIFVAFIFNSHAQIRLPKIIGDNMVLQRGNPVPIWGFASAHEHITVKFLNQEKTAIANDSGCWKVTLSPLKASAQPEEMIIKGNSTIVLSNILVGEVWLCCGQSNMEYPMKLLPSYTRPFKGADSASIELSMTNPYIRLFNVEQVINSPDVTSKGWNSCDSVSMKNFSAAGYYFAKNIQEVLNVPVGMISACWGGSYIEQWTPASAYTVLTAFAEETSKTPLKIDRFVPGRNYNSMVLPLAPYVLSIKRFHIKTGGGTLCLG